jgi:hypothetical protein|tara:strand:- start:946 stop:1485 length:540 start_codon:yes stop_codon:yes gene_type:complete
MIKIILFRGGFAGDLITALHNKDCFIELLPNGKIELDKETTLLQNSNGMSIQQKEEYFDRQNIISCCDSEFALKHQKNTLVIKCDDPLVSGFLCKRFKMYNPEYFTNTSINEYNEDVSKWNSFWPQRFQQQLDISDIFSNANFLDKLDITINEDEKMLFQRWKVINEKNFVIHKETVDQ